ncbi:UvrD-helicase domain-containing protein [Paenibacillus sp. PsM32]|uniref:UvrD-helicase domain-containing protein n=1 Tax=Paenibacillus sp. PsM32 TaxID=3030536 RepID=UPI00263B13C0|nr:UvrD-helicase domain-containing protein [Paenibacillus sp. PsM32]MDN4617853.1 UvrD-helicase domain-containing protein [Paenibacillus sp. PsM32]
MSSIENISDQNIRDSIIINNGNTVISASAGSGKTYTIIKKIEKILSEDIKDHKIIAALTFTIKATKEIRDRVNFSQNNVVVLTNDSFIELEIIRPFLLDVALFKEEYSSDFVIEYSNNFKFRTIKEGCTILKNNNVLGSFWDKKMNFKFKLAHYILENSIAAQQYLKAKYHILFIDEYQDSDQDMHRFFMQLKNLLGLTLFIIGDKKQAIYKWRGAMSNVFELLNEEDFQNYNLFHNFRSDIEIRNYANFLHDEEYFIENQKEVQNVIFLRGQGILNNFETMLKENILDLDKEITIISNSHNVAQEIANSLNRGGYNFIYVPKTPIDEGVVNSLFLKSLAYFSKNERYSIYDFFNDIHFTDLRKNIINEVSNIVNPLKLNINLDSDMIIQTLKKLSDYLGIIISHIEISRFVDTILNTDYQQAFLINNERHQVMTVFGSKGLEFDQVVGFSQDYNIARITQDNDDIEKHYVCVTRAKKKFVMILNEENYLKFVEKRMILKQIRNIFKLI